MLSPGTVEELDGYWAGFLGVPRNRLRPPRPLAVPHAGLGAYEGMYAQAFGGAPVVSLPPALLERFAPAAAEAARGGLRDDERWRGVFGDAVEAVIGPALVACADAGTFRPPLTRAEARPLGWEDHPALDALRAATPPIEWEHGGSELGETPLVGAFSEDGVLAAVAGYEVWGGRIAHLSVVTHPAHRGRRLGTAAVGLAARVALDAGLIPQYRTLGANTSSVRISRGLGFVPYAASLAVRLRMDSLAR